MNRSGINELINFVDFFDRFLASPFTTPFESGELFYECPSFPPVDVYLDEENKSMIFEVALAGYDEPTLEFSGNFLVLKATPNESTDKRKYIKKGIKKVNFTAKYFVPADRYDKDKTTSELKGGMLKVIIPLKSEALPSKIEIKKLN